MKILNEVRNCDICREELPLPPRPILQFHPSSRLLIIGQAPGLKAHESGIPWNDASGVRLREWLGLSTDSFYNPRLVSIVPLGFCYPGKGKSGDLPPRPECRHRWHDSLLSHLRKLELIVLVGRHAAQSYLGPEDFTEQIRKHAEEKSPFLVLPHPSPRNNIWLRKNSWFEKEVLGLIRQKITAPPFLSGGMP